MTRNEARAVIKSHAQTRYSNSVMLLLLRIVDLTWRKNKDEAEIEITTTAALLMRAARVKERQLRTILNELSADQVLLDLTGGKHVSCRLNLEPIERLEVYGDKQKADRKAADAARTVQARERRQKIKAASQMFDLIDDTINADLREKTIKEGLLKDVPEGEAKRSMMNWSIDRIMRAQRNTEGLLAGSVR
jgi:hypothetical protein